MKLSLLALLFFVGCTQKPTQTNQDTNQSTQIANPASVYCINNGNKLKIQTQSDGSQIGICILKNHKECEEWSYFRGECNEN